MARTFYDEMYDASDAVRPHYQTFARWLADTPDELLAQRRSEADLLFHRAGITFTLYGDDQGTGRHRGGNQIRTVHLWAFAGGNGVACRCYCASTLMFFTACSQSG